MSVDVVLIIPPYKVLSGLDMFQVDCKFYSEDLGKILMKQICK